MRSRIARGCLFAAAIVLSAMLPRSAASQAPDTTSSPRDRRAEVRDSMPPCCSIVRIDTTQSLVTARELATGYTFSFEVKTRRVLRTLVVGRRVWADFSKKTVTLSARDTRPCCSIVRAQ